MIRKTIALLLGGIVTAMLGVFTLMSAITGKHFPLSRNIAQAMPGIWGKFLLWLGHELIMGRTIVHAPYPPPEFDGVTILICNHPTVADTPALMGVLAKWGLHPSVVSKVENLKGVTGLFLGWPLSLLGRGVFINRANGNDAKAALASSAHETILIFPDAHRPSKAAIRRDQEKFRDTSLTTLCVPRTGGLNALLSGALSQGRSVRILSVTALSALKKFHVRSDDVTSLFVEDGNIIPPEAMKGVLLDLWRKKEAENLRIRQQPC